MPTAPIGHIDDDRADLIIKRCLTARPRLTLAALASDLLAITAAGNDDPDYYLSLLHAAWRAQAAAA